VVQVSLHHLLFPPGSQIMSNTAPEIKRIISRFCLYGVWLYMQLGSGKMAVSHFFVSLILWLFNVCRAVDEIDKQILQHTSLKVLYFYRQHVTAVFRHTMFGPEGRPQHCCAWLSLACNFPENAHPNVPDEVLITLCLVVLVFCFCWS
jgi:hypothetical protein